MSKMNRLGTAANPYQNLNFKRVLCVCSAGLLRSPTAAVVLAGEPFNFNTRAVGCTEEYALIYADDVLLMWADEIVCMEYEHWDKIQARLDDLGLDTKVHIFDIPDMFAYRDPELIQMITDSANKIWCS